MKSFAARTLVVLGLAGLLFLLWKSAYALLGFGAVLFAVFLRGVASALARWTGMGMRVAVAAVCPTLVTIVALCGWLAGPMIAGQLDQLGATLSTSIEQVRVTLEKTIWGKRIVEALAGSWRELLENLEVDRLFLGG